MINELIESIKEAFSQNQFLSGGTVLMVLGSLLASLRNVPAKLWRLLKRRMILTVEVDSRSEVFQWIQQWLASHPYGKKTKILMMLLKRNVENPNTKDSKYDEERKPPTVILTPAPGVHLLRYKKKFIWINFNRRELKQGDGLIGFHEILTFKMLGDRRDIINSLIEEARAYSYPKSSNYVDIMVESMREWISIDRRIPRSIESLVFDNDLCDHIINDIMTFYRKKDWYHKMGIPWRRGYLLHGEPGNGKTSLVMAVAGAIKTDICIMDLSSDGLYDARLNYLLLNAPDKCIILLEDIHTVDNEKPQNGRACVTVGGLSQFLDGITSQEGRIIFMTTNYFERVNPILIRPGRADVHIYIGNASSSQAEVLFKRFYPTAKDHTTKELTLAIPEKQISMAVLQNHFLKYDNPNLALERVDEILPNTDIQKT